MRHIICHNDFVGLEILVMHIKSKKRLIAYHNINDLTIMKKHVDVNHLALMKKLAKEPTITPTKAPCD
jgi:hypothetical protein